MRCENGLRRLYVRERYKKDAMAGRRTFLKLNVSTFALVLLIYHVCLNPRIFKSSGVNREARGKLMRIHAGLL